MSVLAFATAAVVIVSLLFSLSYLLGRLGEGIGDAARKRGPAIKRWGGVLLIMVGAWLGALGAFPSAFSRLLFG